MEENHENKSGRKGRKFTEIQHQDEFMLNFYDVVVIETLDSNISCFLS